MHTVGPLSDQESWVCRLRPSSDMQRQGTAEPLIQLSSEDTYKRRQLP